MTGWRIATPEEIGLSKRDAERQTRAARKAARKHGIGTNPRIVAANLR